MLATQLPSDQFIRPVRELPTTKLITLMLLRGDADPEVIQAEIIKSFGPEREGRDRILGLAALHTREQYYRSALQVISTISQDRSDSASFDAAVVEVFRDILVGTHQMGAFDQHARGLEILCERWTRAAAVLEPSDTVSSPVLTDGLLVNDLRTRKDEILSGKSEAVVARLLMEAKARAPKAIEDLFRNGILPWIVTLLEQSNALGQIILTSPLYDSTLSRLNDELGRRPDLLVTTWHKELVLAS
jgi:hypothetical protein